MTRAEAELAFAHVLPALPPFVMTSYVPAWKRLGLKLKYANERPSPDQTGQGKRSSSAEALDSDASLTGHPAKRQCRAQKQVSQADPINNFGDVATELKARGPTNNALSNVPAPHATVVGDKSTTSRKKSVSFTDDTKIEDGDSRITIDFPVGGPTQAKVKNKQNFGNNVAKASSDPADVPQDVGKESAATAKKSSPKMGRKKTDQKAEILNKNSLALEYLSQHWSDRGSWKFNKNRDVWILSHALNVHAIPQSYVLALAGYVRGLPEQAGARKRLIDECQKAIDQDQTVLSSGHSEAKQEILLGLDSAQPVDDSILEDVIETHSRPLILLWCLGQDAVVSGEHKEIKKNVEEQTTTSKGQRVKKKKKARVSKSIEISSSESSSDSDSSADLSHSDTDKVTKTGNKVANGAVQYTDSTSSSGSDSESSSATSSESSSNDFDDN